MKKPKLQQSLITPNRTRLRLAEVERLIKSQRIIVPPPSRRQLIRLCEEGVFETVGGRPTNYGWLIYEDSFQQWVREMDGD